jgi:hypothetical protein
MPPVSPQGSRGGLITAVVVFTIGFVTSTIFAIYYGVALNKAQLDSKNIQDQLHIAWSGLPSPRTNQLQAEANNPNLKDKTMLGASIQDTQDLASLVGGDSSIAKPTDSIKGAREALDQIGKVTGTTAPTNLLEAIKTLTAFAVAQAKDANDARTSANAATDEAKRQIELTKETQAKASEQVAEANKVSEQWRNAAQNANNGYEKQSITEAKASDQQMQEFNKKLQDLQTISAVKDKTIEDEKKQISNYQQRLSAIRIHPEESVVRQSDGTINSVADDNIVYIDLGHKDNMIAGMTFEVYSKQDGIPRLGDGMTNDALPVGLGSIEVQSVSQYSSRCRITKLEAGQHFQKGDLIANLVYDRNTKYHFFVFGKFDIAQNGTPNDVDADKVKGLITAWGGKLSKEINLDTDFVVMGAEPKVNVYTPEQLGDPFYVRQQSDEQKAVKDYTEIRDKAIQLSIPILNQNRFLYFCGYYDSAQK